ncbi:unnamed protein product, partial [Prorocentrum cordatum]
FPHLKRDRPDLIVLPPTGHGAALPRPAPAAGPARRGPARSAGGTPGRAGRGLRGRLRAAAGSGRSLAGPAGQRAGGHLRASRSAQLAAFGGPVSCSPFRHVRPAGDVTRLGGYFRPGGARPTVAEWRSGAGEPLVFDTRRGGELHGRLRSALQLRAPGPLRRWSRSPIASLGRAPPEGGARASAGAPAPAAAAGLAFHRHERNELAPARVRAEAVVLPCGGRAAGHCPAPGGRGRAAPPRAAERRAWHGARPLGRGAVGARCMLMPLLCSSTIVPDGVWHCTYNVHVDAEPFTIGVGGMGACASDLQVLAAEGDVAGLEEASLQGAPEAAEAAAIARIAVEQSHLQVLEWAHRRCGDGLLRSRFENGVSLLHLAAGAGEAGVARWLLQRGAEVDAPDASGATAAHWVQLSGSAECLAELHAWGADVEAADLRGGCRPLHYLAGKGHADAARWAVRRAGADAGAKD